MYVCMLRRKVIAIRQANVIIIVLFAVRFGKVGVTVISIRTVNEFTSLI